MYVKHILSFQLIHISKACALLLTKKCETLCRLQKSQTQKGLDLVHPCLDHPVWKERGWQKDDFTWTWITFDFGRLEEGRQAEHRLHWYFFHSSWNLSLEILDICLTEPYIKNVSRKEVQNFAWKKSYIKMSLKEKFKGHLKSWYFWKFRLVLR